ncbi:MULTISPECIES: DUF1937 family protein [Rhodococcus]|uniref:DUF1937 domain-containing protein n=1 Tax=Rhodococcus opacus RKJ300 = JCM 13270 TaxID=1165867 RepID=I0W9N3_RHOOP|nr:MULTISPECIES: DUF1937 family protein [Rhodococcus]EID73099.1 hypothetical protein W59_33373 [Rhodococcus opacus RKJ300 = JCM 13270]QQZ13308.1 DUF1937 family protein [Rhodococcus sp. 21391]
MRKIFLACPYSHADPAVTHERFLASNEVAGYIVESGHAVFSQVSMSHPVNLTFIGKDNTAIGTMWGPVDRVFMDAMEELIILDLPGWDRSSGIRREIEFFESRDRRVSLWSEASAEFVAPESSAVR